jgi:hypothetical protein
MLSISALCVSCYELSNNGLLLTYIWFDSEERLSSIWIIKILLGLFFANVAIINP